MYNHFQKIGFLKGETKVPFNEAVYDGETTSEIFSDKFIAIRAEVHQDTFDKYEGKWGQFPATLIENSPHRS